MAAGKVLYGRRNGILPSLTVDVRSCRQAGCELLGSSKCNSHCNCRGEFSSSQKLDIQSVNLYAIKGLGGGNKQLRSARGEAMFLAAVGIVVCLGFDAGVMYGAYKLLGG